MNRQEYINRLNSIINRDGDDTEREHVEADEILCEMLIELGYEDIVELYYKIGKWYA